MRVPVSQPSLRFAILNVALAVLLVLVLSGCDADDPAGEFRPATEGVLLVATDLPAPGFWQGSDITSINGGFEYRIARELAQRFGLDLRLVEVPFAQLAAGDLGGADLALAQITFTAARQDVLDLTIPYLPANMGVLVRTGDSLRDLAAARDEQWAVQGGTTQETMLSDTIRPSDDPLVLPGVDDAVDALRDGSADAVLLDLPTALAIASESDGAFDVTAQFVTGQQLVGALPKGSGNVEAVDAALRNLEASGRIRDLEASELRPAFGGRDPASIPVIVTRQPRLH